MTNLAINSDCNLRCRYCFAPQGKVAGQTAAGDVSLEAFSRMLDFLQRSRIPEARLVGGEPTLHPRFCELVDQALGRGLRVVLFSNGLMPESALHHLEAKPAGSVVVLINALAPGHPQQADQRASLARLGNRAALGFNIDSPVTDLDFLVDRVLEFGLSPSLRLGLAHPVVGGTNHYLHPREYPMVGERILELAIRASRAGIVLGFDCGFVPCMFPPGSLAALGPGAEEIGCHCGPIPDLLPKGEAIACFPLAGLRRETIENHNADTLRARLNERNSLYRSLGLYRVCKVCKHRVNRKCRGGCLAASMRRLHSRSWARSNTRHREQM